MNSESFIRQIVALLVTFLSAWLWNGTALALDPKKAITQYVHDVWTVRINQQEVRELAPGVPIVREPIGREVHAYRITLTLGQYLRVVVEQRSIDVGVEVFGPDDQLLAQLDGSEHGQESVSLIAKAQGAYRLEVYPVEKEPVPGQYEVRIEELREGTPEDERRIVAEKVSTEARQLCKQEGGESLQRALEKYEEVLPLWRELADRRGEAQTLSGIGTIYRRVNEWQKALEYFGQALRIFQDLGDRRGEADTLSRIGHVYSFLHEQDKALEHLNQALALWRTLGNRLEQADALNIIGWVYASEGKMQKALESSIQALALWRTVGDRIGRMNALGSLGVFYSWLGEYEKALDYYEQVVQLMQTPDPERNPGAADVFRRIGQVYSALGQTQKALEYYRRALVGWRIRGDRSAEAFTLIDIGEVYSSLGQHRRALRYYRQALALNRAIGDRYGEAVTLSHIGSAYASLGQHQKALDSYGQALLLSQAVRGWRIEAETRYRIARVEYERGHLTKARAQIESAQNIIESVRTKVASPELRASYFASVREIYDFYLELLMRHHRRDPSGGHDATALQASEHARARSLLELLTEAHIDVREGIASDLKQREQTIHSRISSLQSRLIRAHT